MCRFLTGKARLQQTAKRRIWELLDNEVFKANNGRLYLAPRTMQTDNYTIPLWIAWLAGSPVDYDTRCSHIHDQCCYNREALMILLNEDELRERGFLRYSAHKGMWVCEDIPKEYLYKRKIGKVETNNLLYECMKAADVPKASRLIIRAGVAFNVGWYIDKWTHKTFDLDLNRIYDRTYWDEHVGAK